MGYNIVHLSDFHFNENNKVSHFEKLKKLIVILQNKSKSNPNLLIIVSGDIAKTGHKKEYKLAGEFFDLLKSHIKEYYLTIDLLFVPGNHDCNLYDKTYETERKSKINKIKSSKKDITDVFINFCLRAQKDYLIFEKQNSSSFEKFSILQNQKVIKSNDMDFHIYLLNTAWASLRKESKSIIMPADYFDLNFIKNDNDNDVYKLIVHHHPRSWFTAEDDQTIKGFVEDNNAIVFTGHEHSEDVHVKETSNNILYSVGGSFEGNPAVFSVFTLNDDLTLEETIYTWDASNQVFTGTEREHKSEKFIKSGFIKPTSEFFKKINDIGMLLHHPNKKEPTLDDLFVNPNISFTNMIGESFTKIIKDNDTILTLLDEERALIDGDFGSGKTTLAKKIFKEFLEIKGKMVLYLDISIDYNIFNSEVKLNNKFKNLLKEQYGQDMCKR